MCIRDSFIFFELFFINNSKLEINKISFFVNAINLYLFYRQLFNIKISLVFCLFCGC
jgi:hypothetical protein